MINDGGVSHTPRTWTEGDSEPADRPKVKDRRGTVWYWRDDLPEYEPGHWTTDWNEHGSWQALTRQLWPLVEVLPDAPEPQPEEQAPPNERARWAQRVYAVLLSYYGDKATADEREHAASMAAAVVAEAGLPPEPSVHPDWLTDDDHVAERSAHADNWEDPNG